MPGSPYSILRDTDVDNTNQVVKVGGGDLAFFQVTNPNTVDVFFQIYDGLTASVSVGTTTPTATFIVPAGTAADHSGAYEYDGPPIKFEIGLIYAATTTVTGGTDPTTGAVLGVMLYR